MNASNNDDDDDIRRSLAHTICIVHNCTQYVHVRNEPAGLFLLDWARTQHDVTSTLE